MDYAIGGMAAMGAGFFSNPLEVIKVRMQVQGELKARGQHAVHYKNVFHAGYVIAKHDGLLALQAGLVSGLGFQLFVNGFRLGAYQTLANKGFMTNSDGSKSFPKTIVAAAVSGGFGASIASPFYLVKTHMQTQAAQKIAYGHQHNHQGNIQAFAKIYKDHGVKGLFRGVSSAIPRASFGSAAQLTSFDFCKYYLKDYETFSSRPILMSFTASMVGGVFIALVMTPFDLVSTRLYNQGVDQHGKGILYKGYFDCVIKVYKTEGFLGFYKGLGAQYFRIGPHTVLTLLFWDELKHYYYANVGKN